MLVEDEFYTPIRCAKSKERIEMGDKVKDFKENYGLLDWCSVFNSYYIRTKGGGKINATSYIKVEDVKENNIDTTRVECRNNHLKKKW